MPDDAGLIDPLLAHLGFSERPAPDADGLRVVHRAFVARLAYDGLTAQLGEHAELDPDALIERALGTGRGGYCFEINTILLTLLRALGFTVERREGIFGARESYADGAATNHLALVATLRDGARFVCDAGWGEGPLEPLALREGTQRQGPFTWTIERDDDGWWVGQHAWGSLPGFRFSDEAVGPERFAEHHRRLATSPDSSFVQTLVVQQPHVDHIVTLRARTLSRKGPAVDRRVVLPDEEAFADTLEHVFGIGAEALGDGRVARLWSGARAQHEAFVSPREPAHPQAG